MRFVITEEKNRKDLGTESRGERIYILLHRHVENAIG